MPLTSQDIYCALGASGDGDIHDIVDRGCRYHLHGILFLHRVKRSLAASCLSHPNGRWIAHAYESIICWDSQVRLVVVLIGVASSLRYQFYLVKGILVGRQVPQKLMQLDAGGMTALQIILYVLEV